MMLTDTLALLRPGWMIVALLIALAAVLWRRRGDLGDWRKAVDPPLLAAIEARGGVRDGRRGRAVSPWLLSAFFLALALAGPALQRPDAGTYRNLDGLLIAMDVSRSVTEGGLFPEARLAAMEVVDGAGSRQAGLIVYAGDAYLASAFTADREALRPLVLGADTALVSEGGSSVSRALSLARTLLDRAGMIGGDIVVVTDGAGIDADARALAASMLAEGRKVHVIFVPAPAKAPAAPDPDPAAAAALATAGGGRLADVGASGAIVSAVGGGLGERIGPTGYAALVWSDFGRAILVLAALPLLLVFRRR